MNIQNFKYNDIRSHDATTTKLLYLYKRNNKRQRTLTCLTSLNVSLKDKWENWEWIYLMVSGDVLYHRVCVCCVHVGILYLYCICPHCAVPLTMCARDVCLCVNVMIISSNEITASFVFGREISLYGVVQSSGLKCSAMNLSEYANLTRLYDYSCIQICLGEICVGWSWKIQCEVAVCL